MSKHKVGKRASVSGAETKDKSERVIQRDKFQHPLDISYPYEIKPRQQELLDIILSKESKIVFVNGVAGTAKTILGAYAGLTLLRDKRVSDIVFVRSFVESAIKQAGALPGGLLDKFQPFMMPLNDKLHELLPAQDIKALINDNRIEYLPVNFLRGASLNVKYVLGDEMQNFHPSEILTLITRLGRYSKMVLCGDSAQSDISDKSGFMRFFDLFNDEASRAQGIYCFSFTRDDIVRNGILRYVLERVETAPWNAPKPAAQDWSPS